MRVVQSLEWLRDLKIGTQSQNSENAQRNLEIAQILRLRETYIPAMYHNLTLRNCTIRSVYL